MMDFLQAMIMSAGATCFALVLSMLSFSKREAELRNRLEALERSNERALDSIETLAAAYASRGLSLGLPAPVMTPEPPEMKNEERPAMKVDAPHVGGETSPVAVPGSYAK